MLGAGKMLSDFNFEKDLMTSSSCRFHSAKTMFPKKLTAEGWYVLGAEAGSVIDLSPRTPYRQHTGILFGAVMIGHLILISAQVQSKAGVPVLEGITFGVFSRIQGGAAGFFRGIGGTWSSYVALRGVKAENEALRQQVAGLEVRLQESALAAARAERLQAMLGCQSTPLPRSRLKSSPATPIRD